MLNKQEIIHSGLGLLAGLLLPPIVFWISEIIIRPQPIGLGILSALSSQWLIIAAVIGLLVPLVAYFFIKNKYGLFAKWMLIGIVIVAVIWAILGLIAF